MLVGSARLRGDEGVTIVELLVGIAILALLLGAVASALIVGMRTTDQTTERLNESHDVQISSRTTSRARGRSRWRAGGAARARPRS